jgi:hypothetical protein
MAQPLPSWITPQQFSVLDDIRAELEQRGIAWMAVGGLAGNLWGSTWPLHDIDIDVPSEALSALADHWAPFITAQGRYVDGEFDIELLRLRIRNVEADLSGADYAYVFAPSGIRKALPNTLSQRVQRRLDGLTIPCQRLEDLIAYKTAIGRTDDLRELTKLKDHP